MNRGTTASTSRRGFLSLSAAAGLSLFLPRASRAHAATNGKPPNVVLIVSDDQRWGDFGFMGHPHIRTPNLDRLAEESATFPHGYTPTSLCRASLATIITGLYGHQHQICCNDPPEGVDRDELLPFMRNAPALPRILGERLKYRSLQTGKWWEGHYSNGGFTQGMTLNRKGGRHGDKGLRIGRETMKPIYDFIDESKRDGVPFFVWYAPMMPHTPHDPPEELLKRYRKVAADEDEAKYWAMCEWFDRTCGKLLDHLENAGLAENTLVAFVVDNGWLLDDRPPRDEKTMTTRAKRSPFDAGVRTPVMLRWPTGGIKAGWHDATLASTVDLAPTILAACGLEPTPGMQGMNLLPLARGEAKASERKAVFGEIFHHDAVAVGKAELSLRYRWVREGDWKLIEPVTGAPMLFNLAADPGERQNLAQQEGQRVDHLRALLEAWWKAPMRSAPPHE